MGPAGERNRQGKEWSHGNMEFQKTKASHGPDFQKSQKCFSGNKWRNFILSSVGQPETCPSERHTWQITLASSLPSSISWRW